MLLRLLFFHSSRSVMAWLVWQGAWPPCPSRIDEKAFIPNSPGHEYFDRQRPCHPFRVFRAGSSTKRMKQDSWVWAQSSLASPIFAHSLKAAPINHGLRSSPCIRFCLKPPGPSFHADRLASEAHSLYLHYHLCILSPISRPKLSLPLFSRYASKRRPVLAILDAHSFLTTCCFHLHFLHSQHTIPLLRRGLVPDREYSLLFRVHRKLPAGFIA